MKKQIKKIVIMLIINIIIISGFLTLVYGLMMDYKSILIFLGGSVLLRFGYEMSKSINLKL